MWIFPWKCSINFHSVFERNEATQLRHAYFIFGTYTHIQVSFDGEKRRDPKFEDTLWNGPWKVGVCFKPGKVIKLGAAQKMNLASDEINLSKANENLKRMAHFYEILMRFCSSSNGIPMTFRFDFNNISRRFYIWLKFDNLDLTRICIINLKRTWWEYYEIWQENKYNDFLSIFTIKMLLLSMKQFLRGVFCHSSDPYNECRHFWGVSAYLCWMILLVICSFICFRWKPDNHL